jgi:hypothetical protein
MPPGKGMYGSMKPPKKKAAPKRKMGAKKKMMGRK